MIRMELADVWRIICFSNRKTRIYHQIRPLPPVHVSLTVECILLLAHSKFLSFSNHFTIYLNELSHEVRYSVQVIEAVCSLLLAQNLSNFITSLFHGVENSFFKTCIDSF